MNLKLFSKIRNYLGIFLLLSRRLIHQFGKKEIEKNFGFFFMKEFFLKNIFGDFSLRIILKKNFRNNQQGEVDQR